MFIVIRPPEWTLPKGQFPTVALTPTKTADNSGGRDLVQARKHICVVDDDAAFLNAITRLICAFGFDATPRGSLSTLREHLRVPAGGCVLADVLPEGEIGFGIPELLRAFDERAPVLFIPETDDRATIRHAGRSGVRHCLKKPVEASDLLESLEAAFGTTEPETRT